MPATTPRSILDDFDRLVAPYLRARSQARGCRCGNDMPGRCPGPENCPALETDDDGSRCTCPMCQSERGS